MALSLCRIEYCGPGIDPVDRLLDSRKTVGNEEQYVYETAGPEFLQQPLPDEGSFVWEKPKPQENAPSVFGLAQSGGVEGLLLNALAGALQP